MHCPYFRLEQIPAVQCCSKKGWRSLSTRNLLQSTRFCCSDDLSLTSQLRLRCNGIEPQNTKPVKLDHSASRRRSINYSIWQTSSLCLSMVNRAEIHFVFGQRVAMFSQHQVYFLPRRCFLLCLRLPEFGVSGRDNVLREQVPNILVG